MIYTAAQTTASVKNPAQMGVSASTRKYLADNEGLMFVQDLIDFVETETWNQITDNMRRPPMIPDPDNADHMIRQAAFLLYANSLGRLRIAAVEVSFFIMTYRPLSADIMIYDSRLNNFKVNMDAIK